MKIDVKDISKIELKENDILLIQFDETKVTAEMLDLLYEAIDKLRGWHPNDFLILPKNKFNFKKIYRSKNK